MTGRAEAMTDEQPLPPNRALLHRELENETARTLVILTGFASSEAELMNLVKTSMNARLEEVEKELSDDPPEVA
jgi:hypothetical protein